jgi:mono/diheme cytochrome c family protein
VYKSLVVVLGSAALLAGASVRASQAETEPSGAALFTSAQAAAGGKTYAASCSKCHGANLEGVSAPALRGAGSGLAGTSVGDAFTFISTQMPAGNPGSLSNTEYANVVAYILSRNGHAAGPTSLTAVSAKASKVKV